jgi:hypothetical protein
MGTTSSSTCPPLGSRGRIGDGSQWVSWIHIDDVLAIVRWALDDDSLSGAVQVTSPTRSATPS